MSDVKPFEFIVDWTRIELAIGFDFDTEYPLLFRISIGPLSFRIQKILYWKRYFE